MQIEVGGFLAEAVTKRLEGIFLEKNCHFEEFGLCTYDSYGVIKFVIATYGLIKLDVQRRAPYCTEKELIVPRIEFGSSAKSDRETRHGFLVTLLSQLLDQNPAPNQALCSCGYARCLSQPASGSSWDCHNGPTSCLTR